jgi:hypothetical protein
MSYFWQITNNHCIAILARDAQFAFTFGELLWSSTVWPFSDLKEETLVSG